MSKSLADIQTVVRYLIDDQLKSDGRDMWTYKTNNVFTLLEDFISVSTIKVYLNGTLLTLTTDYTYNSSTNQITIDVHGSGIGLTYGDNILITYSYYKKYSDAELEGFINGAFSYFFEFRYTNTFSWGSGDVLVSTTSAGVAANATASESYIVALVAAIMIAPDNQSIRTNELTISARQNKSKKDQISETISRWMAYSGNFTELVDDELIGDYWGDAA